MPYYSLHFAGKDLVSIVFSMAFNDVSSIDSGRCSIDSFHLPHLQPINLQIDFILHFAEDDSGYDAESVISSTGLVVEWDEDDFAEFRPPVAMEVDPPHEDDLEDDPLDDVPLDQLLGHLPDFEDNQARFDFWADRGFFNGPLQDQVDINAVPEDELVEDVLPIAADPVAQAMVVAGLGDLVWWIPRNEPVEPMDIDF